MKRWGTATRVQEEYEERVSAIGACYQNLFKERFYYVYVFSFHLRQYLCTFIATRQWQLKCREFSKAC
jgi:hypothetical protein